MAGNRVARPLPKRRRLASAQPGCKPSSTLTFELTEDQLDTLANGPALCTSCHRNFAQRPHDVVRCARFALRIPAICATDCPRRCRTTTCLVCSRTCTAPPLSLPPTPALTRSPTPSMTPHPSPRRPALALSTNSRTSNGTATTAPSLCGGTATGKRRKPLPWDPEDSDRANSPSDDEKVGKDMERSGCGRTVCRKCCLENPVRCAWPHCSQYPPNQWAKSSVFSATATCYDCLNQPYSPPTQQFDARGSH